MLEPKKQQTEVIVLDACILISNVLRFISLSLAQKGYFQPAWSPIIRDEWLRNASRLWSVERAQLALDWDQWDEQFPLADQGIIHNWKEGLQYSDPKDWHVIAAARAAQVRFPGRLVRILTLNSKDFNRGELRRLGLERYEPDLFFCSLWPEAQEDFCTILNQMPEAVTAPDKPMLTVPELLKRERLFNLSKRFGQQQPL